MSRDELLWVLNAFLDGTSQTDDLVFKAEQAVAWLEDESNKVDLVKKVENGWNYSCNEFQVDGWLLTSTE